MFKPIKFFKNLVSNIKNAVSQLINPTIKNESIATPQETLPSEPNTLSYDYETLYDNVPSNDTDTYINDYYINQPEPIKTTQKPIRKSKAELEAERINNIKNDLQPIIDEANSRWKALESTDYLSMAIENALDSNNQIKYFDISQLTNYNDIITEVTRARIFLNDKTSTIQGAELLTRQESARQQYKGMFGGQFNNWVYKFKNYDIFNINEEQAKATFRLYRDIESQYGALIQEYGSENLIVEIYDSVVRNNIYDEDDFDITRQEIEENLLNTVGASGREIERELDKANQEFNKTFYNVYYREKDLTLNNDELYF